MRSTSAKGDNNMKGNIYDRLPSLHGELLGVFHSTKMKSNGTESFRKFVSKISVHLLRLSFFLEIWKFRKFPVPFGISTRFESAPAPLVAKSYKMAASLSSRHYTGCKMICPSSSLFLIENKNVRI